MPSGNASNPAPTRCVLWHPRHERPDADLTASLTRKGFGIHAAADGFAALTRLCAPAGVRGRSPAILLVQDPSRVGPAAIAQILAVTDLFAPRATAWLFDRPTGKPPILRAVTPADRQAWSAALPAPAGVVAPSKAPPPDSRPKVITRPEAVARLAPRPVFTRTSFSSAPLRLAGEGPLTPAPPSESPASRETSENPTAPAQSGASVPTSHLLTDEELAMLLAHDPSTTHTSLSEPPAQGSGPTRADLAGRAPKGEPTLGPSVPDPHRPRA